MYFRADHTRRATGMMQRVQKEKWTMQSGAYLLPASRDWDWDGMEPGPQSVSIVKLGPKFLRNDIEYVSNFKLNLSIVLPYYLL
jgi:hypothetical protein